MEDIKKNEDKYYLCNKNGIVTNDEEIDVSNVTLIEYQNSDNDSIKLGYASFSNGNLNLGSFKGATKIKRTLIASGLNSFSPRSIDLTSYEGYQNFTSDQFIIANVTQSLTHLVTSVDKSSPLNPSYNPLNGILTIDSSYAWDNRYNFFVNYDIYLLTIE